MGVISFFLRLFFLPAFIFTACYGEAHLTSEQSSVLKVFFQTLVKESEIGYVLFDAKPVCILGFHTKDLFCVGFPAHSQAIALKEGARIWQQISHSSLNNDNNPDIILNVTESEDINLPGQLHILAINIPLLRQVVEGNIALFKYILGPTFTTDSFLNTLIENKEHFYRLLKGDKVLIGIILGYGTENSLFGSRLENVMDILDQQIPPFLPLDLLTHRFEKEYLPFEQALEYASLKDELEELEKKIVISTDKLTRENPEFIFGCLKDLKENKSFTDMLEATQSRIQDHLKSPHFLADTLKKLGYENLTPFNVDAFKFKCDENEIDLIIAKGVWDSLQNYDYEFLPFFMNGFEKQEAETATSQRTAEFPSYRKEFLEGRESLARANKFFESLNQEKAYRCVVPGMLYYKKVQEGEPGQECTNHLALLNYSIFSPLGHSLGHQSHVWINLNNTVSGFANGIKGMRINETREIYIHPSLAYGFNTSLEKCIHLKVVATLEDLYEIDEAIKPIEIEELSFLLDPIVAKQRDDNYRLALEKKGWRVARHLEKLKSLDLKRILDQMRQFYLNKETFSLTTTTEQSQINQIHWNIYY